MKSYKGIVRSVVYRNEIGNSYSSGTINSESIINFRLELIGDVKNNVVNRSVELRGDSIRGNLHEGDEVEVLGSEKHGIIYAKEIHNITTHAIVKTKNRGKLRLVAIIIGLVVFAGGMYFIINEFNSFSPTFTFRP